MEKREGTTALQKSKRRVRASCSHKPAAEAKCQFLAAGEDARPCSRAVYCKGLCTQHYFHARRHQEAPQRHKECQWRLHVGGGTQTCAQPVHCKGFCVQHYFQVRRQRESVDRHKKCQWRLVSGAVCGRGVHAHALCNLHYKRFLRRADELPPEPAPGKKRPRAFCGQESMDESSCGTDDEGGRAPEEYDDGHSVALYLLQQEASCGFSSSDEDDDDEDDEEARAPRKKRMLRDVPPTLDALESLIKSGTLPRAKHVLDAEWFVNSRWLAETASERRPLRTK